MTELPGELDDEFSVCVTCEDCSSDKLALPAQPAVNIKEAKNILQDFVNDISSTSSGFTYPYCLYHYGLANEGLGNKKEAIKNYTEMLKYWGSADRQLDEIVNARERLTRLTTQSMK